MISKLTSLIAILIAASLISAHSNFFELAFAEKISKDTEKKCQVLYRVYKFLGNEKFLDRYFKKSYTNDCLKLYNNPNWTFKGKSTIDANSKNTKDETDYDINLKGHVKIISKQKINSNKYITGFSICAKKDQINEPRILVISDKEKIVGKSKILIPSDNCRKVFSTVKADNPNSIRTILLAEKAFVPSTIKTIMIK